jgi:hypothetical protein
MNSSVSAHTQSQDPRLLIESFEQAFAKLDSQTRTVLHEVSDEMLYARTAPLGVPDASIGELILKSAGSVEQTFGGLTANLWDDPFEWTLPETLSSKLLVSKYLDEVVEARTAFFARLKFDRELTKLVAVPSGDTQPLIRLLIGTLMRAAGYLERAAFLLALLSQASPPKV